MKTALARERALISNDLGRSLKRLRDGTADASATAAACIALSGKVPYAVLVRQLRALGVLEWLSDLRSGDALRLAGRSPAFGAVPIDQAPAKRATAVEIAVGPENLRHRDIDARPVVPAHATQRLRPTREYRTLTSEEVKAIHVALVKDFASTPDPIVPSGVKDPDMLESAVSRQFTSLGGEPKYKKLGDMAASLFYGLALNHPFHNGNKRTAIVALLCLADANGLTVTATQQELYRFVLDVVEHRFRPTTTMAMTNAIDAEVATMAGWITQHSRRRVHYERVVRWRELKGVLGQHGVTVIPASGSQLELTRGKLRSVVDFDGDTRAVGPAIVRKIRQDLHLTPRDGCDDDVFYGATLPLDHFIAKYRGLLRDLARV
jgi:death-on-curing protein